MKWGLYPPKFKVFPCTLPLKVSIYKLRSGLLSPTIGIDQDQMAANQVQCRKSRIGENINKVLQEKINIFTGEFQAMIQAFEERKQFPYFLNPGSGKKIKMVIRSLIAICLLVVSIDAVSSPLDQGQPSDGLAKGISLVSESPVNTPKDTNSINAEIDTSFYRINTTYKAALNRLEQQATVIKEYAAVNGFNTDYCFLVDMSIPSGKNRFFVYNLKKGSVETSSLVAHGFGSTKSNSYAELEFSNEPNSFKTSLGKYKIGGAYKGTFGLSYKLYGLENTNDRAFERTIVLHADAHVPEKEPFPYYIYQSAGCPTVSPSFLSILSKYIRVSQKPILLWIYYS